MAGEPVRYPCAVASLAVIGAGYVGLTTACCLAHLGHDVVATDRDLARLALLKEGRSPIVEDGLEPLLAQGLDSGRLRFEADNRLAAAGAEFVFLCVPTPSGPDGRADMSYIRSAAEEIGPVLAPDAVVVNKSTVPVGSTKVVERALGRADVAVVSNPEFLREGTAVWDFLHPDRIVIGAEEESVAIRVSGLFLKLSAPLVVCEPASAETIKYASNAFLATKISFVNAMAALCEAVGADIRQVTLGMGYDRRIGAEFLRPGPGWGGSCFPKDTAALLRIAEDNGYDFSLLDGVVGVNEEQRLRIVDKAARLAGGHLDGVTVALWGLTFKARTDDLRDSPALDIARLCLERGATVRAYDPTVAAGTSVGSGPLDALTTHGDPYAAATGAHVVVLATEWDEFRWVDFQKVAEVMAHPALVDARNLLEPSVLRRAGFAYEGLGLA